jgi:glycerol uptake facilitator-like aquaporin
MKQRQIAALLVELLGTFVLVMVVLNVSRYGLPFFTAIAMGVAVAAFMSAVGKFSGANLNPAVTLGLFSIKENSFVRTIAYIVAQALGALGAWQLYEYLTQRTLKNATTSWDWRIFIAEMVGFLIIGVVWGAVVKQKITGWQAAATIGCAIFLGATVANLASNGLLNPALALGVRSFDLNYFLGPVVGAIVGMNLYVFAIGPMAKKAAVAKAVVKKAPAKKAPAKKAKKAKK